MEKELLQKRITKDLMFKKSVIEMIYFEFAKEMARIKERVNKKKSS